MLACCQQELDTQNAVVQGATTTSTVHQVQHDDMPNKARVKDTQSSFFWISVYQVIDADKVHKSQCPLTR